MYCRTAHTTGENQSIQVFWQIMSLSFLSMASFGFCWSFRKFFVGEHIFMLFLISGWIDPSRLLGNREPIIPWKLQKIRAILSALFLGRHIKGALEPQHRYHSGPCGRWIYLWYLCFSLWSCPCCSSKVTLLLLWRKLLHAFCLPLTAIAWSWSEIHTELSKVWDLSRPLPLHPWRQVCWYEKAQTHWHRACPAGLHQILWSRSIADQDLPWMVLIGLRTDWKS